MKTFTHFSQLLTLVLTVLFCGISSAQTKQSFGVRPIEKTAPSLIHLDGKAHQIIPRQFIGGNLPSQQTPTLRKAPRRTEESGSQVICEENFNLWTAGTEQDPDTVSMTSNWWIDDNMMQQPGWSGATLTQAGGACGMAWPTGAGGGALNTPLGEYDGHVTITFRARACREASKCMFVVIACHDMENTQMIDDGLYDGFYATQEWETHTFEFDCKYSGQDAFMQIGSYGDGVIDDVKVTVDNSGMISAPEMLEATDYTIDGFTANWGKVSKADEYLLTCFSNKLTSKEDSVDVSMDPVTVQNDGDIVETGNNGGLITDFKFTYEVLDESIDWDSENGVDLGWFEWEGWDGFNWQGICASYCSSPTKTIDYSSKVAGKYYAIRLTASGLDSSQVRFTFNYTTTTPTERDYVLNEEPVTGTSYTFTGLDPETDYFYYTRARNTAEDITSDMPTKGISAFGISKPVVTEATDVDERGGFTANWEPTPKAAYYDVERFDIYTAAEEEQNHAVINDDFSLITTSATIDDPYYMDNMSFDPVSDEYTKQNGWYGYLLAYINGGIGCAGYPTMGIGGALETPEFSSQNNGGKYHVKMTYWAADGDYLAVVNKAGVGGYVDGTGSWQTVEFDLSDGQKFDNIEFYSYSCYDFFIKDIVIATDLKAGDEVATYISTERVEGKENASLRISSLESTPNTTYGYDVYAYHTYYSKTAVSERSDMMEVDVFGNKPEGPEEGLAALAGEWEVATLDYDDEWNIIEGPKANFTLTYTNGNLYLTRMQLDDQDYTVSVECQQNDEGKLVLKLYDVTEGSLETFAYYFNMEDYEPQDALIEIVDNNSLKFLTDYSVGQYDDDTYDYDEIVVNVGTIAYRVGGTGVEGVKTDNPKNGECYNIAGIRVADGFKGIVIKGGKKYIAK